MAVRSLEAGPLRVRVLDDGTFITDAGGVLGGGKSAKIRGAMRPTLVESHDSLALIDSGFGPDLPENLRQSYELRREQSLMDSLREAGHEPKDVTHVLLSHLDPDHIGWALRPRSFPNATIYFQEEALRGAVNLPEGKENKEMSSSVGENIEKGIEEGWCELMDGDAEILPGIRAEVRPGHVAGHQIFWIGDGDDAVLFTADLAPAKIWLNPDRISNSDTDPEAARHNRVEVLAEAEKRGARVILYHEPRDFIVTIRSAGGSFDGVPYKG